MKAKSFDRKVESGEDLTRHLELAGSKRVNRQPRRVNVDFPEWMVTALDNEAARLGVTRQSIIKFWLAERLEQTG